MFRKSKKRAFTLLEVLIAFLLIVICLVPLLAPYPFIYRQQKKIVEELEIDRLASLAFVDLLSKIYKKEIDHLSMPRGKSGRPK